MKDEKENYRREILEMVKWIEDLSFLKKIFSFVKVFVDN